jgi:hypothetical protein
VLQYVCDWCKRTIKTNEHWILGFAAENLGATTQTTEMTICSQWAATSAGHPLAVHFCSEKHKNAYIRLLFDTTEERRSRRVKHASPRVSNPTRIAAQERTSVSLHGEAQAEQLAAPVRHRNRGRKTKVAEARFGEADYIRSRGLSVRLDDTLVDADNRPLTEYWFGG